MKIMVDNLSESVYIVTIEEEIVMTVFELVGTSAWETKCNETRIGLFSTRDNAEAKVAEIKKSKDWQKSWTGLFVIEVKVDA